MPDHHIILANLSPAEGSERDFDDLWPTHLREAVSNIDGFIAAQRLRLAEPQRPRASPTEWSRVAIYDLEGDDVDAIHEADLAVRESGIYTPFGHTVATGNLASVFSPVGTPYRRKGWNGRRASRISIVRLNATEGRHDAFNAWQDIHIQECVEGIAGYAAAERYRLNASQRPGMRPSPWEYITIYELDDTHVEAISESADQFRTAQLFTANDGCVAPGVVSNDYVPVGRAITG